MYSRRLVASDLMFQKGLNVGSSRVAKGDFGHFLSSEQDADDCN